LISVRDAMRRAAEWYHDRPAIISNDHVVTFGEAWCRGISLANGLIALGLKPGDRVAVLEENCLEASDFFLGTAIANLVRVPLYKRNSREAHAQMVRHTGCRALVVSSSVADEVEGLQSDCPDLAHVIVRDHGYEQWLAGQSVVDPDPVIELDDFYIIRHSGGTTGLPKGMAFSNQAWMNTERDWTYRLPAIEPGDHCVHVAPISHGSGYLFVPIWMNGGVNVLEPKFEAGRALELLSRYGGYFFAVPTMISDMLAESAGKDFAFSRQKAIVIGGSPILPKTSLDARALFGNCLHQMYGQTEATPVVWMTPNEWFNGPEGAEPLLAAGRVMPFAEVQVRDDDNLRVADGVVGEIALRADGQMQCIWNEPELTTQRLVDGWVLTGDVGKLDKYGYLYLVDRKDDMIISGGFNIWPAELEVVIADLPEVREVARRPPRSSCCTMVPC
jgi:acyl-CoA synthetase (AMP-forming)/AMP-acid ligase II